jgi:hypothetical protein
VKHCESCARGENEGVPAGERVRYVDASGDSYEEWLCEDHVAMAYEDDENARTTRSILRRCRWGSACATGDWVNTSGPAVEAFVACSNPSHWENVD